MRVVDKIYIDRPRHAASTSNSVESSAQKKYNKLMPCMHEPNMVTAVQSTQMSFKIEA